MIVKIIIYHRGYGCDTGCCGHEVRTDDGRSEFTFDHPGTDWRTWAEELVASEFGPEHVADLDWDYCLILDDS